MPIVGLLGGVASGKSTVGHHLKDLGWHVIVADDIAHIVLTYPQIIRQMQLRWNIPVLREGQVDRGSIAKIVFTDAAELQWLEKLMFPEIEKIIRFQLKEHVNVVLDAPTLLKGNLQSLCDQIWYIACPRDIRLKRYQDRTGSDGADMDRRDALLTLERARELASFIIDGSCSVEDVMEAVSMKSKDLYDKSEHHPNGLHES